MKIVCGENNGNRHGYILMLREIGCLFIENGFQTIPQFSFLSFGSVIIRFHIVNSTGLYKGAIFIALQLIIGYNERQQQCLCTNAKQQANTWLQCIAYL